MTPKKSIRALMFGWEFPPHISGGLGTACKGIVHSLLRQGVEILFVIPKASGDECTCDFRLLSASEVDVTKKMREFKSKFTYVPVPSALVPYTTPELFSLEVKQETVHVRTSLCRFQFSGHYGKNLFEEVSNYASVAAQIADDHDFDIIHAHDWLTFPAGLAAKEVSGKPLVVHVHATEFDRSGENINPDVFRTEQEGMRGADHVIAVSELTKQILISRYGINAEKISVVHNGIQPNTLPKAKKKVTDKIVTFLGRVTLQKGPEYFVSAAHKVLQRMPHVQFVMAGNGDKLEEMIRMAAALGIGSRFHFTGFLRGEEVNSLLSQSDLYVMPSVSEPFGISPLEAIQVDVPVIISKQSGVSETIKHAIKVDFWDVDALADAMYGVLKHSPLSEFLSQGARAEVDSLTWDEPARRILKIYNQLT
jgi:glycosyltransferase involved in cell wall biosynthesis